MAVNSQEILKEALTLRQRGMDIVDLVSPSILY